MYIEIVRDNHDNWKKYPWTNTGTKESPHEVGTVIYIYCITSY